MILEVYLRLLIASNSQLFCKILCSLTELCKKMLHRVLMNLSIKELVTTFGLLSHKHMLQTLLELCQGGDGFRHHDR